MAAAVDDDTLALNKKRKEKTGLVEKIKKVLQVYIMIA